MNNNRVNLLFLMLVLISSACNRQDADLVIAEIRTNEEFLLEFREQFDYDGIKTIVAKIGTTQTYDCDQGSLRNTFVQSGSDALLINLIGLDFPPAGECIGEDIVASEIHLRDLEEYRTYELQISVLDEIKAIGSLVVTSEKIRISMPSDAAENGILVNSSEIYRVPSNVVWGFIDEEGINSDSTLQRFVNEMESFGTPMETIAEFGHFQIQQNGTALVYDFEKNVATTTNQGFAIKLIEDFDAIRALVDSDFCIGNNRIRIFNTNGEVITCN